MKKRHEWMVVVGVCVAAAHGEECKKYWGVDGTDGTCGGVTGAVVQWWCVQNWEEDKKCAVEVKEGEWCTVVC